MQNVFVTGAAGFIGKALVKKILEQNDVNLRIITRRKNHPFDNRDRVKVFIGDFTDRHFLKEALKGCHYGFHLAAKISFNPKDKEEVFHVNVEGTRRLCRAAADAGVSKIVFASSAITIGVSRTRQVLDERHQALPCDIKRNIYLQSKIEAENVALNESYGDLKIVAVNPVTVFGEGDNELNSGSLIKTVAKSKFLPVPCGGTSVVDIEDTAQGFIAALKQGQAGNRYILAGQNLLFSELFSIIAEVIQRKPCFIPLCGFFRQPLSAAIVIRNYAQKLMGKDNWLITPQIIEDTFYYKYYSSQKAQNELGWTAQKSFRESVVRAWEYYRQKNLI